MAPHATNGTSEDTTPATATLEPGLAESKAKVQMPKFPRYDDKRVIDPPYANGKIEPQLSMIRMKQETTGRVA